MGNEFSRNDPTFDENASPRTLSNRTVHGVADYIRSGHVKNAVFMVGAGISTSAGIPDFRSPDTGLYANLAKLNLPRPEAVFDISYFRENPLAFYTLARDLYPGKIRPTVAHSFIKLLCDKGVVSKVFTQNIDCLERAAGVPPELIIEAHGSFSSHHCIDCKSEYPDDLMREKVQALDIPHCLTPQCNGLVKPDIVFFGEALPTRFFDEIGAAGEADLAIVMGTSLTVYPFAALPMQLREEAPRVLINLEKVGGLGSRLDDVLILENCDDGVRKLAKALGWAEELEKLWEETDPARREGNGEQRQPNYDGPKDMDEMLRNQVECLTRDVERSLNMAESHRHCVHAELKKEDEEKAKEKEEQKWTMPQADPQSPGPIPAHSPAQTLPEPTTSTRGETNTQSPQRKDITVTTTAAASVAPAKPGKTTSGPGNNVMPYSYYT